MKKLFGNVIAVLAVFLITSLSMTVVAQTACCAARVSAQAKEQIAEAKDTTTTVEAYYFHTARRCVTCQAVEKVAKEALQEYYGNKIVLKSINLDDAANRELAQKMKVNGLSLIMVNGSKMVNLTNDAFMNAVNRPERLKEKIKETVDSLM